MVRRNISLNGVEALIGKLKRNASLDDVKQVVKNNTVEMSGNIQRKSAVDTGYMRRSVHYKLSGNGLTGSVGPTAEYAPYVEYGTRFQSAQPFVRPSHTTQKRKFKVDLERLMK